MKQHLNNNINCLKIVLKHGRFSAVLLLILMIITGLTYPLNTIILTRLINEGIVSFQGGQLSEQFIIFGVLFLIVLVYYNLHSLLYDILKINISRSLRDHLLPNILHKTYKLDYSNFEDPDVKNLIARVGSSPDNQFTNIFWQFLFLPSAIISLIGYLMIFLASSWMLLILIFFVSIISIIVESRASSKQYSHQVSKTQDTRKANYLSQLITSKESLQEIRTFQSSEYLNEKWKIIQTDLTKSKMRLNIKLARNSARVMILSFIITAGSLAFFIFLLNNNRLDYGQFVSYTSAILVLIDLVTWEIPYGLSQLNSSSMYWNDYQTFMDLPEFDESGKVEIDNFQKIEFRDVYFTYPNSQEVVLKGLSCVINKNDSITIVGPNAAGKSTMIKLLLRLYRPDQGSIYIDNYNLNDLSHQSIVRLFSPVFQEFYNYKLTVRENIAFGEITELNNDNKLHQTVERMMLSEDLEKLPSGLDTHLGKVFHDGVDLSGGQWQKLSLARAVFSSSPVIILDEPTSALDPKSEAKIYSDFALVIPNRTTIFISHRLGIARLSKKIFVVDEGTIVEEGSHDELMKHQGKYYEMFMAQSEWYR